MTNNNQNYQKGITQELSRNAYYLIFSLENESNLNQAFDVLREEVDGKSLIVGLGQGVMSRVSNPFYHPYKAEGNAKKLAPEESGYDLALWLKSKDLGNLFHRVSYLIKHLSVAFKVKDIIQGITYQFYQKDDKMINHGLDEFEDGTENPEGDAIYQTAISEDGASFWSLQKWQHDFDKLDHMSQNEKERLIGRSLDDNHEFGDNDDSAHVKRTAQESFDPEAFIWRRSMPWIDKEGQRLEGGLMFSSFAASFYPFDTQFNRMVGNEDGIVDGVFKFSKVLYTAFFYCPPIKDNEVDLSFLASEKESIAL